MEYNEIIGLMQEMTKRGLTRIMIQKDDFKLELEKNNGISKERNLSESAITFQPSAVEYNTADSIAYNAVKENIVQEEELPGTKKILSPMVGTFYSQPAPDKPAYINAGDVVKKGQTVCIIEAMKLMNEIESEVEGEVIKCLVENEDMVEFGQPLFVVK